MVPGAASAGRCAPAVAGSAARPVRAPRVMPRVELTGHCISVCISRLLVLVGVACSALTARGSLAGTRSTRRQGDSASISPVRRAAVERFAHAT